MTMAVSSAMPWDAAPSEAPATTHGKQQRTSSAPSDGVMNAFAATLAAMLAPALPLGSTAPDAEATSELDAPSAATTATTATTATKGTKVTGQRTTDPRKPGDTYLVATISANHPRRSLAGVAPPCLRNSAVSRFRVLRVLRG